VGSYNMQNNMSVSASWMDMLGSVFRATEFEFGSAAHLGDLDQPTS
jgi:hypothetical protein